MPARNPKESTFWTSPETYCFAVVPGIVVYCSILNQFRKQFDIIWSRVASIKGMFRRYFNE
jgi:hypothetical protein